MEADDLQAPDVGADMAQQASDRRIADRLEALNAHDAERVIQRALELESESLDQPHEITTEQLERIAKEIGVDPAFVHQALGEVRLASDQRSRISRWILPDDLVETTTITGLSREDTDAAIKKWMTQNEGLTPGGMLDDGIEWSIDRRWRSRVLSKSLNGNNRISRVASGDVTHRVHSTSDQEHVVAFQSDGRLPQLFAYLTMATGTTLAAFLLLGAAVSNDLLNGLGVFALITGLSALTAVTGARWWAKGIRAALKRSLIGLATKAKPKRKTWRQKRQDKKNKQT